MDETAPSGLRRGGADRGDHGIVKGSGMPRVCCARPCHIGGMPNGRCVRRRVARPVTPPA